MRPFLMGPRQLRVWVMDCIALGYCSREAGIAKLREENLWPVRLPLYHEPAGCREWLASWDDLVTSGELFGVTPGDGGEEQGE